MATSYSVFIKLQTEGASKANNDLAALSKNAKQSASSAQASTSSFSAFGNKLKEVSESNGFLNSSINLLTKALPMLADALPITALVFFGEKVAEVGDEIQTLQMRLHSGGIAMNQITPAFSRVAKAAEESHTSLEDFTEVLQKVGLGTKEVGSSFNQQVEATESFASALKLGGASSMAMRSSILELSHAFDRGKMSIQQYNILSMESKVLTEALSKAWINSSNSADSFADAVKKGEVNSKALLQTLIAAKPELLSQVNTFQLMSFALTDLKSKFLDAAQQSRFFTDVSRAAYTVIEALGDLISGLVSGVGFLYTAFSNAVSPLTQLIDSFSSASSSGAVFEDIITGVSTGLKAFIVFLSNTIATILQFGKTILDVGKSLATWDFNSIKGDLNDLNRYFISISDVTKLVTANNKDLNASFDQMGDAVKKPIPEIQELFEQLKTIKGEFTEPLTLDLSVKTGKASISDISSYLNISEFNKAYQTIVSNIDVIINKLGGELPESALEAQTAVKSLALSVSKTGKVSYDQVAKLEQYNKAIAEIRQQVMDTSNSFPKLSFGSFAQSLQSKILSPLDIATNAATDFAGSFANAFISIQNGTESTGKAFAKMALSVIEDIERMVIESLILKGIRTAIGGFSTGGVVSSNTPPQRFASGGHVSGVGTSTSDSIPAMLSDGEFVMRASAVRSLGVNNLNKLNSGGVKSLASSNVNTFKSQQNVINISTTVNAPQQSNDTGNKQQQSSEQAKLIANLVNTQVKQELVKQTRVGGVLHSGSK